MPHKIKKKPKDANELIDDLYHLYLGELDDDIKEIVEKVHGRVDPNLVLMTQLLRNTGEKK